MSENIIRVALYMRCSTELQELTLQEETLDKHIQRLREDNPTTEYIIEKFKDNNLSGKNTNRPEFQRLMKIIEMNKIDLVVVTALDRLSRSLQDLLNTTNLFQAHSCNFIVVGKSIDTTNAQGRLLFHILGAFAEFERETIRERMEAGRKRAEVSGTKSGLPCHRPKTSKVDEDGVVYKYKQGISMNQISKMYGVSITPIRRVLKNRKMI